MGNQMLSVVSTFLYVLLIGRVLLVYEPPEMEGLFYEPFPGTLKGPCLVLVIE